MIYGNAEIVNRVFQKYTDMSKFFLPDIGAVILHFLVFLRPSSSRNLDCSLKDLVGLVLRCDGLISPLQWACIFFAGGLHGTKLTTRQIR